MQQAGSTCQSGLETSANLQLVVSLLTTTSGYNRATLVLLGTSASSLVAEFLWINVVYKSFPVLAEKEQTETATSSKTRQTAREWAANELKTWRVYASLPVFWSRSPG